MGLCFICDAKLFGERTRVCSSITPHSNVPYPEKICELMGEDFVVIVTPSDHMCKKCSALLTHMDKLENDLKLIKNAMLSYIQKKYGLLPADQPVRTLDIVNGNLRTEELGVGQKKVPSGLSLRDNSGNSSLKMLRTPQQPESTSKMKIYKCGFCAFQSKELGHVRFHMRTHVDKGNSEKVQQTTTKTSNPIPPQHQKKRLFRCQVCSMSFDNREACLEHIQKDHNQQTTTTAEKEAESVPTETPQVGQQAVSMGEEVAEQEVKGDVEDTVMLLNHNEEAAVGSSETQITGDEHAVVLRVETQGISDNAEKKVEDMEIDNKDNKHGDLDIESMLAAIHHDAPSSNIV